MLITKKNLKRRYKSERRFKLLGLLSISFALTFLALLLVSMLVRGSSAFFATKIELQVDLTSYDQASEINYRQVVKTALRDQFLSLDLPSSSLRTSRSEVEQSRNDELSTRNDLYQLVSKLASLELKKHIAKHPEILGHKVSLGFSASSKVDMYFKRHQQYALNDRQKTRIAELTKNHQIKTGFNTNFFTYADSREPEIAGIHAGTTGSFLVVLVFIIFAFPIGVMSAFYLEEFARANWFTHAIEITINNLAAIPSIIYGILGLALYLHFLHLPRSSALVGGLTLLMMMLPIIIISTRSAIRLIPRSIVDGAVALGASKTQIVLHHLLPLSMPGIMTGTILAVSRAIGETAPLLMIGMVAFVADVPKNIFDPATTLPVQIYLWSDSPEFGFAEKAAAAVIVLIALLVCINLVAIILRKKFEVKF